MIPMREYWKRQIYFVRWDIHSTMTQINNLKWKRIRLKHGSNSEMEKLIKLSNQTQSPKHNEIFEC